MYVSVFDDVFCFLSRKQKQISSIIKEKGVIKLWKRKNKKLAESIKHNAIMPISYYIDDTQ